MRARRFATQDHYYSEDCVLMRGGLMNQVEDRPGGYGWEDASCTEFHRSRSIEEGGHIRTPTEEQCLCEWPATLAPEFAALDKSDWYQRYPSGRYLTRSILFGFFGYLYIVLVFYFVFCSAKALIRKQLHVSDDAVLQNAKKRREKEEANPEEGKEVTFDDVTHEDWNDEFLRLVRQAQTPNPLTAGEPELQ